MNVSFSDVLHEIGKAGQRLAEIDACEGAAGNISVYLQQGFDPGTSFLPRAMIDLPLAVPELAGSAFIASGSGSRLREIHLDPAAHLAVLVVQPGGRTAKLFSGPHPSFSRVTSEFNSHLAIHQDQIGRSGTPFLALIHAQPLRLTFLSQVPRYREPRFLSRRLLRWQPELILNLPEGLGVAPFIVPGTEALMQASLEKIRQHRLIVWSKHGVMARSAESVLKACDCIEYIETAARYELLNLQFGEMAEGLTDDEVRAIAATYSVPQDLF